MPYKIFLQGILSFSIFFIAIFICSYSYLFLVKTNKHRERRPWEFLFVASVLFMVFELLSLLTNVGFIEVSFIDIIFVSNIFEFLYSGFVLLAFVSQHDLILKSHLILISKKDSPEDIRRKVDNEIKQKILKD